MSDKYDDYREECDKTGYKPMPRRMFFVGDATADGVPVEVHGAEKQSLLEMIERGARLTDFTS